MIEFIRRHILPQYGIAADVATVAPLGHGHINGTWKVDWPSPESFPATYPYRP